MVDVVISHVSAHSAWFNTSGGRPASGSSSALSQAGPHVVPHLRIAVRDGGRRAPVWTTAATRSVSSFANPGVLLAMVDVLLYVAHGASMIRLDAIAYLWKTIGTGCIHLDETRGRAPFQPSRPDCAGRDPGHRDEFHAENVSCFGDGADKLVYQFTLPPLLLHSPRDATSSAGRRGGESVDQTSFFNFLRPGRDRGTPGGGFSRRKSGVGGAGRTQRGRIAGPTATAPQPLRAGVLLRRSQAGGWRA